MEKNERRRAVAFIFLIYGVSYNLKQCCYVSKRLSKIHTQILSYVESRFNNLYRLHILYCQTARVGEHAWTGRLGTVVVW